MNVSDGELSDMEAIASEEWYVQMDSSLAGEKAISGEDDRDVNQMDSTHTINKIPGGDARDEYHQLNIAEREDENRQMGPATATDKRHEGHSEDEKRPVRSDRPHDRMTEMLNNLARNKVAVRKNGRNFRESDEELMTAMTSHYHHDQENRSEDREVNYEATASHNSLVQRGAVETKIENDLITEKLSYFAREEVDAGLLDSEFDESAQELAANMTLQCQEEQDSHSHHREADEEIHGLCNILVTQEAVETKIEGEIMLNLNEEFYNRVVADKSTETDNVVVNNHDLNRETWYDAPQLNRISAKDESGGAKIEGEVAHFEDVPTIDTVLDEKIELQAHEMDQASAGHTAADEEIRIMFSDKSGSSDEVATPNAFMDPENGRLGVVTGRTANMVIEFEVLPKDEAHIGNRTEHEESNSFLRNSSLTEMGDFSDIEMPDALVESENGQVDVVADYRADMVALKSEDLMMDEVGHDERNNLFGEVRDSMDNETAAWTTEPWKYHNKSTTSQKVVIAETDAHHNLTGTRNYGSSSSYLEDGHAHLVVANRPREYFAADQAREHENKMDLDKSDEQNPRVEGEHGVDIKIPFPYDRHYNAQGGSSYLKQDYPTHVITGIVTSDDGDCCMTGVIPIRELPNDDSERELRRANNNSIDMVLENPQLKSNLLGAIDPSPPFESDDGTMKKKCQAVDVTPSDQLPQEDKKNKNRQAKETPAKIKVFEILLHNKMKDKARQKGDSSPANVQPKKKLSRKANTITRDKSPEVKIKSDYDGDFVLPRAKRQRLNVSKADGKSCAARNQQQAVDTFTLKHKPEDSNGSDASYASSSSSISLKRHVVIDLSCEVVLKYFARPGPGFPRFDSGDVSICLRNKHKKMTYQLHSDVLSRVSPWFKQTLRESIKDLDDEVAARLTKLTHITARYELCVDNDPDFPVLSRVTLTELEKVKRGKLSYSAKTTPRAFKGTKINTTDSISHDTDHRSIIEEEDVKDDVLDAYDNLLNIYYSIGPRIAPQDIDKALRQAEYLIYFALLYRSEAIVRPFINSCLLNYGLPLYEAIYKHPPRWLKLAISVECGPIFKEAIIHIVGNFPNWPWTSCLVDDFPIQVEKLVQTKIEDVKALRMDFRYKCWDNTICVDGKRIYCYGRDIDCDSVDYSTLNTWRVVQKWHDWCNWTLIQGNKVRNKIRVNAFDSKFYHILRKSGDSYLPINTVLSELSAANLGRFHHEDKEQAREDLNMMKHYAQKIVEPLLVNRSMLDVEVMGIGYLTCTEVRNEELPWVK